MSFSSKGPSFPIPQCAQGCNEIPQVQWDPLQLRVLLVVAYRVPSVKRSFTLLLAN